MSAEAPDFRLGSVLATSFTGTLSERYGIAVERIPSRGRLRDWFAVSGLSVASCDDDAFSSARRLREAIHAVGTAAVSGEKLSPEAVAIVNDASMIGRASAVLDSEGERRWALNPGSEAVDALGVVAADAVDIISGERAGRLALCASSTCRAVFFDTSQSRTRRWCDMNTCGNRQKKARIAARSAIVTSR